MADENQTTPPTPPTPPASPAAPTTPDSPWDLDVDAGSPSRGERIASRGSVICLAAGGAVFVALAVYGIAAFGWPARSALEASLLFAAPALVAGCLLLQIASTMSQHRDDAARKVAWEEHTRSLKPPEASPELSGPAASDGGAPGEDDGPEAGEPS